MCFCLWKVDVSGVGRADEGAGVGVWVGIGEDLEERYMYEQGSYVS